MIERKALARTANWDCEIKKTSLNNQTSRGRFFSFSFTSFFSLKIPILTLKSKLRASNDSSLQEVNEAKKTLRRILSSQKFSFVACELKKSSDVFVTTVIGKTRHDTTLAINQHYYNELSLRVWNSPLEKRTQNKNEIERKIVKVFQYVFRHSSILRIWKQLELWKQRN